MRWRTAGVGLVLAVLLPLLAAGAGTAAPMAAPAPARGDAMAHLDQLLARSPAPEYRRFGSPGMARSADYAAGVLERAGYTVLRRDYPSTVYQPDYSPGAAPALVRLRDGHAFRTETAFHLQAQTPPQGITCTVRAVDRVRKGDCGFVPLLKDSPEWKHTFVEDLAGQVDAVIARGGVGVVLQGDVDRQALIALSVRRPIPAVVSLAREQEVLGQRVRLRVRGEDRPAVLHDVIAVRPPRDSRRGSTLLEGHLDGWFSAAADNGGGAAAVLAAAERLAGDHGAAADRGLVVALYDGEEWGLLGSKAFAADLADADGVRVGACGPTLRMQDLVSVVNLDAPSAIASDLVGALGRATGSPLSIVSYRGLVASEEPTLTALFLRAMTTAGVLGLPLPVQVVNPLLGGGTDRTDAKWFTAAGIPVAWPVAEYPEYHTTADTRATVDPADLDRVVRGTVSLVRLLDDARIGRIVPGLPAPGVRTQPDPRCPAAP